MAVNVGVAVAGMGVDVGGGVVDGCGVGADGFSPESIATTIAMTRQAKKTAAMISGF